jgi:hypothetical protein
VTATETKLRVVIAVTETSLVPPLWEAAMQLLRESPGELVALFVEGDHWHRAASLPFTREIPRVGGAAADFTRQRAEQLHQEAITRTRQLIQQLAREANISPEFTVMPERDASRIREAVGASNVLLIPSFISDRPIFEQLSTLGCRILIVEAGEDNPREFA